MISIETLEVWMRYLLPGVGETLKATVVAGCIFPIVGILVCYLRMLNKPLLNIVVTAYVEFFRGTPLIGQLFVCYYVLPFFGVRFPAFAVGFCVLGLNSGAYASEAFRAAIESIPVEQWEAGRILNLSTIFIFFRIILPQAVQVFLPVMGNELITLLRATAALSLLGVRELLFRARDLSTATYQPFPIMTIVLILYFLMSYPASLLVRFIEQRLRFEYE